MLETINWMDVVPAVLAVVILLGAMFMLVSGIWASRNQ